MRIAKRITTVFLIILAISAYSQGYNGYYQEFGKNRIQYTTFEWNQYDFDRYNVYYYGSGATNASYVAQVAPDILANLENRFDYYLDGKVEFIIYNSHSDFRQTNSTQSYCCGGNFITTGQNNMGSEKYATSKVTKVRDSKVFLYFDGDHKNLESQISAGIANIIIHRLMLGKNWKEIVKNSTLITIPDWYINGLVSYVSDPNNRVVEDHIKDGIVSGRYREFNKLSSEQAQYAGHAIWSYVAKTYGEKVIPNILYMSRLSRNIESGFLYVIGLSLKSLNNETLSFFKEYYRDLEEYGDFPKKEISAKISSKKQVRQVRISPDGRYISYIVNELGKYEVVLYDVSSQKTKTILRGGNKTSWMPDYESLILQWHPQSESLAIITQDKGKSMLTLISTDKKDKVTRPLLKFNKVLSMSYSPDGKKLIMSAVKDGQTDLFEYNVLSSNVKQLTDDIYDDKDPVYLNQNKVLFSSNRYDDTLRLVQRTEPVASNYDLYSLKIRRGGNTLDRVTNTPDFNEFQPLNYDSTNFVYLIDKGETIQRQIAYFDSVISHIDTVFHYRNITVSEEMDGYSRNIKEHHFAPLQNKMTQLFFKDGAYFISIENITKDDKETLDNDNNTLNTDEAKIADETIDRSDSPRVAYQLYPILSHKLPETDYNDYQFEFEEGKGKIEKSKSTTIAQPSDTVTVEKQDVSPFDNESVFVPEFRLPSTTPYTVKFSAIDVHSEFNFNYTSQMYQRYLGNLGYMNTKIAMENYAIMSDMFNDYEIMGGIRISLDWSVKEYYLKYTNRSKRLNKEYIFERQTNEFPLVSQRYKIEYTQTQLQLNYPLTERMRLGGSGSIRYDRFLALSTEGSSLNAPTQSEALAGLKAEFVYDNTTSLGLNLMKGTRYKFSAETYNSIYTAEYSSGTSTGDSSIISPATTLQPVTIILGLDYRKYIQVHRQIIWANRFTAATSIGTNKLLYYMGGVDNKVHFTDQPRFNFDLPVVDGQPYNFQTVATNVRGFLQNTRNGNNMALFSSELRVPVFAYLSAKPVRSDFVKNFQTVLFADVGTAWSGLNPYSDDNYFNTTVVGGQGGDPVKVILRNQDEPVISGYGFGFRSRFLAYFVKLDFAWGLEDGRLNSPKSYLSVGLDF